MGSLNSYHIHLIKTIKFNKQMLKFKLLDCEYSVEQKDALLGPFLQAAAVFCTLLKVGYIVLELDENVFERGRKRNAVWHTERQAVRLVVVVIRILAYDYYFDLENLWLVLKC
jgi:hypothetical protein